MVSDAGLAAEDGAARQALAVAEVVLVNDMAQLAARDGSSRSAEQAAEQSTSQTAYGHAHRASDGTKGRTDLGTRQRAGRAAGGSGDAADGAAGLAAHAARDYLGGFTDRKSVV